MGYEVVSSYRMIGPMPKRPDGRTPDALFDQWVYDTLQLLLRPQQVDGTMVQRTTRGIAIIPDPQKTGVGTSIGNDWRWA